MWMPESLLRPSKVLSERDTCSCIQEAVALLPGLNEYFEKRRTSLSLLAVDSLVSQEPLQLSDHKINCTAVWQRGREQSLRHTVL
jgi:hypothetical protein